MAATGTGSQAKRVSVSTSELEDSIQVDIEVEKMDQQEGMELIPEFAGSSTMEFIATDCPVKNVTVFLDQAEVNRLISVNLQSKESDVLIKGLPRVIDQNSVRVQCYGDATIIEVAYKEIVKKNTEETDRKKTEAEELELQKEKLLKSLQELNTRKDLIKKEKSLLEGYGNRLGGIASKNDKVVDLFEKKTLENLTSFLEYYDSHSKRWNKSVSELDEEIDRVNKEISAIDERLMKLKPESVFGSASKIDRCVSVLLEAEKACEVKLVLSYVVQEAKWSPLYDLRAFSKDNILQLLYFGIIQQTTGEDWNDTKISLSTALPSVGGSPPDLTTQLLTVDSFAFSRVAKKSRSKRFSGAQRKEFKGNLFMTEDQAEELQEGTALGFGGGSLFGAQARDLPEAEPTEGITSTSFEIARPATIKCDSTGHKVSICQIDFTPQFEYQAVPKLVAHAFLKAKVKNQSQYAMLAGPVNVFLDNNFLTKSSLPAVSPSEEFEVPLGADPSLKITYQPLKKFRQTSGLLTKTVNLSYHQVIVVKNTKQQPVKITVSDQLPKSTDEKIKVTLLEPELKVTKQDPTGAKGPVHINDKNNIEWVCEIPAGESKEINLKYTVDHPAAVNIKGL